MNRTTAKIAGNALVAFGITFSAVEIVSEGRIQFVSVYAGLLAGITQGILAGGKELISYGEAPCAPLKKKHKILKAVTLF